MKRHALVKHLREYDCELFREGAGHSIYWNPANRKISAVPRHVEVSDKLARKICKDLGIPDVKGV